MQQYDYLFKSSEIRICIPLPVLIQRDEEHGWQLLTKIDMFSRIKKKILQLLNREKEEFVLDLDTPGTYLIQATFASYFVNARDDLVQLDHGLSEYSLAPALSMLPWLSRRYGIWCPLVHPAARRQNATLLARVLPASGSPKRRFFLRGRRQEVRFRQL